MAEILDVDIDEEEFVEDTEADIRRLKSSVRKRKGRGFKEDTSDERPNETFDSINSGGTTGPQKSVEGWILFVTDVHEEAQEDDVHNLFADHGEIKNMHLNLDRRTGYLKGYALIEYETFKEAQNALEACNGEELLGQKVFVDWAFTKGPINKKMKKGRSNRKCLWIGRSRKDPSIRR